MARLSSTLKQKHLAFQDAPSTAAKAGILRLYDVTKAINKVLSNVSLMCVSSDVMMITETRD
jgi:hypothetical protein